MKILVTGANGFVGQALISALEKRNIMYVGAVRHKNQNFSCSFVEVGSIDGKTNWEYALEDVDVVIHLAARVHVMNDQSDDPWVAFSNVNVDGTRNLALHAAKSNVKRFVFVSSIKVNGEFTNNGQLFTENDSPNPQDSYAMSKLEAEHELLLISQQTGMDVVIVRPPLIYGPGVKANFSSMLKAVQRGVPLPLGALNNKRSFVYVENLVSFILFCMEHPLAANQTFLVSDGHDLSTTELLQESASALGVQSRLVPVPQKLLEIIACFLGKRDVAQRLCGNLQLDINKARTLLGWTPPFTVREGLKKTVANLRKMP